MPEEEENTNTPANDIGRTVENDKAFEQYLRNDNANEIAGVNLRPVTLPSISFMRDAGSQIVQGTAQANHISNQMLEVMLFVYIHSADEDEVMECSLSDNPRAAFKRAAHKHCKHLTPKNLPDTILKIMEILIKATNTRVEVMPDEEDLKDEKKSQEEPSLAQPSDSSQS